MSLLPTSNEDQVHLIREDNVKNQGFSKADMPLNEETGLLSGDKRTVLDACFWRNSLHQHNVYLTLSPGAKGLRHFTKR